jgi:hypothetical protein
VARNLLAVRRAWLRPVWCGVAALFLWNTAAAQYLEPGEHRRPDTRFVSAGVLQREFHPLASNILPDSLAIRYDQLMPVIGFRHGVLDILAGYTRYRLRGAKREALIISASASQELLLAGGA